MPQENNTPKVSITQQQIKVFRKKRPPLPPKLVEKYGRAALLAGVAAVERKRREYAELRGKEGGTDGR